MEKTETSLSVIKEVALKFLQGVTDKSYFEVIDQIVDENCVIHSLFGDLHGKLAMQRVVHGWVGGFPDVVVQVTQVIAEGDLVTVLWTAKGTHLGEFRGIEASHKAVIYSGTSICRVRREKITEYWSYLDYQYLLNHINS